MRILRLTAILAAVLTPALPAVMFSPVEAQAQTAQNRGNQSAATNSNRVSQSAWGRSIAPARPVAGNVGNAQVGANQTAPISAQAAAGTNAGQRTPTAAQGVGQGTVTGTAAQGRTTGTAQAPGGFTAQISSDGTIRVIPGNAAQGLPVGTTTGATAQAAPVNQTGTTVNQAGAGVNQTGTTITTPTLQTAPSGSTSVSGDGTVQVGPNGSVQVVPPGLSRTSPTVQVSPSTGSVQLTPNPGSTTPNGTVSTGATQQQFVNGTSPQPVNGVSPTQGF